jgi:hypothetical protein
MRLLVRAVAIAVCALPVLPQTEGFQFRFEPRERLWTLQNGVVSAQFQLTQTGNFVFRSFTDLRNGDTWSAPQDAASSPVRMQAGDFTFDSSTAFTLARQFSRSIPRGGRRQFIVLNERNRNGQVTVELEMYARQPFLRYQVQYRNLLSSPVRVRAIDLLPWSFSNEGAPFRTFRVNQWVNHGLQGNFEPIQDTLSPDNGRVTLRTGAHGQHCTWLALRDGSNRGLVTGWEFDGRVDASATHRGVDGMLSLTASIQEINREVAPDAVLQTPSAFIGLFHGDWDDAGWATQKFTEAAIAKPIPDDNFPYVVWDSWKYQQDISEAVLRRNAEIAADLGIEVFVVDLGWAMHIGNWQPDPRKFPNGLRALSDYVHSLGMKFGLHFPFAEAAPESPVLRFNPDWRSSETYNYFDAYSLCLSHEPVKEWVIDQAIRLIDEYNVDWILQDGENMVKRCTKRTHTHDPQDSNFSNAVDGLNAVVTAVQTLRPKVHWENCEDGGNMMTFNMVKNYVTTIAADDSGALKTRQAVYGITYPFSPRYADRYMPEDEFEKHRLRSFMFGGPWIFMNRLPAISPELLELAKSEIAIYKSIRKKIREGRVYHLTARPAETRVDALQSYHEATDTSIVLISRPSAPNNIRLRPRGLKPDVSYRVRFQDSPRVLVMTGAQLMQTGIVPNLPGMWSADIMYIEPVATPAQSAQ